MSGGRIRSIKPEWLEDERLLAAGSDSRVLSIALILLADDSGRGRITVVTGATIFPLDSRVFDEALASLRGWFVRLYEVRTQRYYEIVNWRKHQRIDRPSKPRTPEPSEGVYLDPAPDDPDPRPRPPPPSRRARETLAPDLDLDLDQGGGGDAREAREPRAPQRPPPPPESNTRASAPVLRLAANRGPEPPGEVADEVRRLLLAGYRDRFEGKLSDAWMGAGAAGQHVTTVVGWVLSTADRTGDPPHALVDRLLDGFFARDDLRRTRWPWRWLAEDPGRYGAPPDAASVSADTEAAFEAEYEALQAAKSDAYAMRDSDASWVELERIKAAEADLRRRRNAAISEAG